MANTGMIINFLNKTNYRELKNLDPKDFSIFSLKELKKTWKELLKKYHPDVAREENENKELAQKINLWYEACVPFFETEFNSNWVKYEAQSEDKAISAISKKPFEYGKDYTSEDILNYLLYKFGLNRWKWVIEDEVESKLKAMIDKKMKQNPVWSMDFENIFRTTCFTLHKLDKMEWLLTEYIVSREPKKSFVNRFRTLVDPVKVEEPAIARLKMIRQNILSGLGDNILRFQRELLRYDKETQTAVENFDKFFAPMYNKKSKDAAYLSGITEIQALWPEFISEVDGGPFAWQNYPGYNFQEVEKNFKVLENGIREIDKENIERLELALEQRRQKLGPEFKRADLFLLPVSRR